MAVAASLTDYTTYSEVRAAIGVSVDEVPDATLALPMYAEALLMDLEEIDTVNDLPGDFATVAAKDIAARTDTEQKFFAAVGLYAPYSVVKLMASSLPLFSVKSLTDGKAGFSRDSTAPYKEALKAAVVQGEWFKNQLARRYAAFRNSSVNPILPQLISIASPSTDPITG